MLDDTLKTQLKAYLDSWKASQGAQEQAQEKLPNRPDKLTQVIDEIRAEAWREAGVKLDEQKAESDAKIKALEETVAKLTLASKS